MATTFPVRFFLAIPEEFAGPVTGTYSVTGSISHLLINNTNTGSGESIYEVGDNGGWFPGPPTIAYDPDPLEGYLSYGIIVGGADLYANAGSDGRTSEVSCWGFPENGYTSQDQQALDELFVALAGNILGTTYANVNLAKTALRNAGFYYQYPVGFEGQSPNTGDGSDV